MEIKDLIRKLYDKDGEIEHSKEVDEAKADDYTEYERENEWSYYDRNADLDRMR